MTRTRTIRGGLKLASKGLIFPKLLTVLLLALAVGSIWFVQANRNEQTTRVVKPSKPPRTIVPGPGDMANKAASPEDSKVSLQVIPHGNLDAEIRFHVDGAFLGSVVVRAKSAAPDNSRLDVEPGRYTVVIQYRNPHTRELVDTATVPLEIEQSAGVPVLDLDRAKVSRLPFANHTQPSSQMPTMLPSSK